jgi:hypothetical protein
MLMTKHCNRERKLKKDLRKTYSVRLILRPQQWFATSSPQWSRFAEPVDGFHKPCIWCIYLCTWKPTKTVINKPWQPIQSQLMNSLFDFKDTSKSTLSVFKWTHFLLTILAATLNTHSDGAEVAGIAKNHWCQQPNMGKLFYMCFPSYKGIGRFPIKETSL